MQKTLLTIFLSVSSLGIAQTVTTSAGDSTWGAIVDVAVDGAGDQYAVSVSGSVVYKVDRLGASTVFAGRINSSGYSGDGGLASNAQLYAPAGIALDKAGNVYIADGYTSRIRKVGTNGIITTIAGKGGSGFSGDGGAAVNASLSGPEGIVVDANSNVLFVDHGNYRIRRIDPSGMITTIVGRGDPNFSGDGGPPLLAGLNPGSLALGPDGSLYITDAGYGNNGYPRVRRVSPSGTISTVAGNGIRSYSGDGGPATMASFEDIGALAVDSAGNLYIATGNRIRKVDLQGIVTTYAGGSRAGASGDGGPANQATFNAPDGLAFDTANNLYVAEYYNHDVRKIAPAAGPSLVSTLPSFIGKASFSSNTYLEIYGSNLAQTTRTWAGSDFSGANAPTSLDGVSVSINGKPAFVYYISPTQINVNTPDDTATGPVPIQVTNALGTGSMSGVARARVSPSLQTVSQFLVGGKQYVVAQTPDFKSFIGRPGMIGGLAFTPAKPGDTVSIYALGCGLTNPATPAGTVTSQTANLVLPYMVTVGGVPARITFAGVVANSIGLYQFNVVIPAVAAGDQSIELTVDGISNGQKLFLVVGSN